MTTYTITANAAYGSHEIAFDVKPAASVLAALRALGLHWNPKRAIWYGFRSPDDIRAAIEAAQPETVPAQVAAPGYLGATAISGAKSGKRLYGAELSAAIRADLKAAGVKGVTVSVKSYTGGQYLRATIKATAADLAPLDVYAASWQPSMRDCLVEISDGYISRSEYLTRTANERAAGQSLPATQLDAAQIQYNHATAPDYHHNVNQYAIDGYTQYTDAFRAKLHAVNNIIRNYRYDNSNSMVDYFDTNFYYDLTVKMA